MFKYAYRVDDKPQIEEFDTLDDARERAYQHWCLRSQGRLVGWKFGLITDVKDKVLLDPSEFEKWRKTNKRIVRV
jgi:hypothetical protein